MSRVDSETDRRLAARGRDDLRGRLAIANAKLAYQQYKELFSGPRWEALAARGATKQRCLWASTSTKDPSYRDTLYVDELIGPETITTMPEETIAAFQDHGRVERRLETELDAAQQVFRELYAAGVDYDDVVATLEREGIEKFDAAFNELLKGIADKRQLRAPSRRPAQNGGRQGRGISTASRVPAPRFDSMSSAPLTDATRSRIPTSPNPPSAPRSWEKPRPSSSTARTTDRSRQAKAMRTVVASACLTTFVKASCVIRKMAVSSFAGSRVPAGRSISRSTFGPPRSSRRAAQVFEGRRETELVERGRTKRERQPADVLERAARVLPQGCRRLTGLRKRRRSIDRREAEEDRRERGARLVV